MCHKCRLLIGRDVIVPYLQVSDWPDIFVIYITNYDLSTFAQFLTNEFLSTFAQFLINEFLEFL